MKRAALIGGIAVLVTVPATAAVTTAVNGDSAPSYTYSAPQKAKAQATPAQQVEAARTPITTTAEATAAETTAAEATPTALDTAAKEAKQAKAERARSARRAARAPRRMNARDYAAQDCREERFEDPFEFRFENGGGREALKRCIGRELNKATANCREERFEDSFEFSIDYGTGRRAMSRCVLDEVN